MVKWAAAGTALIAIIVLVLSFLDFSAPETEPEVAEGERVEVTVYKVESGDIFATDRDGETWFIQMEDAFFADIRPKIGQKIALTVDTDNDIITIDNK